MIAISSVDTGGYYYVRKMETAGNSDEFQEGSYYFCGHQFYSDAGRFCRTVWQIQGQSESVGICCKNRQGI